ncbi:flavin reductase [Streptomyces sp. NBC_00659]|uniref:flavin reductase n=1 Tax=Streptomyces sp. NBC_00659 TaxID=2903669 RepID=UPI002E328C73|nr:flavin reductase [Streptomyces sp. NBC_00659]
MTTAVDGGTFRQVLARWPSGVGIVTTAGAAGRHGMTASSFSSVSLDPPLVLVCVDRRLRSHELLDRNGVFAVNVLGRDHIGLGRRFAGMEPEVTDRFAEGDWLPGATGSPVLTDAAAWVDCRVRNGYPGGDHTIFVGDVVAACVPRITSPLLFHSRAWGQLADPLPQSVGITDTGLARTLHEQGAPPRRGARLVATVRAAGIPVVVPHGSLRTARSAPRWSDAAGTEPRTPAGEPGAPAYAGALTTPGPPAVHVRSAAQAVEAAEAGCLRVEVTVLADGTGTAARAVIRAVAGSATTVVARVRDAMAPGLARTVLRTVAALKAAGCAEISLVEARPGPGAAGAPGALDGSPLHLRALLQDVVPEADGLPVRLALRDHHGLGLVNALTAMKSGVRHFEAGLGGCGGLLPTERLVLLCSRMGVATPVGPEVPRSWVNELERMRYGRPLPARVAPDQ